MATKVYFENVTSLQDLEKKFKKLVVALHPDKNGNTDESNKVFNKMRAEYEAIKSALNGGSATVADGYNFADNTCTFNGRVYDYSDSAKESVKVAQKNIVSDYRDFLRSLNGTVEVLQSLYNKKDYEVKRDIDYLCTVCHVSANDFFDVSFIKSCYLKHSFRLADGGTINNVLCEKRYLSDKTDLRKLESRCANYGFDVVLDIYIEKAQTEKGKDKEFYYFPVLNFSCTNVLKHLVNNTYKVKLTAFNRAKSAKKKADAKKARKQAQKAKKASNK